MAAGPPAAVVHSTPPIRSGPARGGDGVPMSTYQDTNLISPDALVLGYQVRDHHLPNRPPLAQADTYAQALRAVEQLQQAYRRSLAANGEGTAGLSQSLMVLAVTAAGTELRYLSAAGGPPST